MAIQHLFPRGIASGDAFCNRTQERLRVAKNIKLLEHSLIMSPRRYGKTSLVRFVVKEMGVVYGEADLFIAIDAKRIVQRILVGIKQIIDQVSSPLEQKLKILSNYFQRVNPKWIVGTKGISVELIPSVEDEVASNITEALQALEYLLKEKKQKVVLFIDEIQEIGEIAESKGIEGAIRHVAQASQYISFIFSGSNRRLLSNMFFDKARPLYKLCDRMVLERIPEEEYILHLNHYAEIQWKQMLDTATLDCIFNLTECHPFYINVLCRRLWEQDPLPNEEIVQEIWFDFVDEERIEMIRELSTLSQGQRRILLSIAEGNDQGLTSKAALTELNMSSSTISENIHILEKKDHIERKKNGALYLIDPLIKAILLRYYSDDMSCK